MSQHAGGPMLGVVIMLIGVWLSGCASVSAVLHGSSSSRGEVTRPAVSVAIEAPRSVSSVESVGSGLGEMVVLASFESPVASEARLELALKLRDGAEETAEFDAAAEQDLPEYDPWEPFNQSMFSLNRRVDRYVLKPVATAYDVVVPDPVQRGFRNMFHNVAFVPRLVNNLLQLKFGGAARELARFLINSTFGIGGLLDVAKHEFGIERSQEDTGQTLAVWGIGPGPYLILPLLPPLTVRDGVGATVDVLLNPLTYFAPVEAPIGAAAGDAVNERSLNLELYEGVEESVLDLYTAVRNGYLQRRQHAAGN